MYKYSHGGDIYSYDGTQILDFSANINPLGLPSGVKRAIIEATDFCDIYPDPLNRNLRQAISSFENIPINYIFCGNGAADLLFRLCIALKPKKALLAVPSFSEYREALNSVDCQIAYHYMTEANGFNLTESYLDTISSDIDLAFLCNPNNPTGHLIERSLLGQIVKKCYKCGVVLVIDECFVDFVSNAPDCTVKNWLTRYPNLVVLKAFTKMYAMAGVRLGYGFCHNPHLLDSIYQNGQPWNVSTLAQAAGIAATQEKAYVDKSLKIISKERQLLSQALTDYGCQVYHSQANFIFFKCSNLNLKEQLLDQNILIRSCENYLGLGPGYFRIAVKLPLENATLIRALKKLNQ